MSVRRRWIVFDDPPSASELLGGTNATNWKKVEWAETTFYVNVREPSAEALPATAATAGPAASTQQLNTTSIFEDVEMGTLSDSEEEEESLVPAPMMVPATQFTQEQRAQYTQQRAQFTQTQRRSRIVQQPSNRMTTSNSTVLEESMISDSDEDIGIPPRFEWDVCDVTPLGEVYRMYKSSFTKRGLKVNCLVAIRSINPPRDVGKDKRLATLDTVDASGATLEIKLWGRTADDWMKAIRPGDIVWLGGLSLSEYQKKLSGSVSCRTSSLQLCWRTRVQGLEDPNDFTFHRAHAVLDEEAAAVIRLLDYYLKVYT